MPGSRVAPAACLAGVVRVAPAARLPVCEALEGIRSKGLSGTAGHVCHSGLDPESSAAGREGRKGD